MNFYVGDCLDVMKTLEANSIDCVITSPPYADLKTYGDFKGVHPDKYVDWIFPIIQEIYRLLKSTGSFILNINDKIENKFRHPYVFDLVSKICKETEFKLYDRLFWNKMKGLPLQNRFSDRVEFIFWFVKDKNFVFNIDQMRIPYSNSSLNRMKQPIKNRFVRTNENQNENKYKVWNKNILGASPTTLINICSESKLISSKHMAVFPEKLVEYFLKGCTNDNMKVLDPFCGCGTTGVVCKKLKRDFIGIDLNKDYIEITKKRINDII